MSLKHIHKLAKQKHLKVMNLIKCSLGMSVGELSKKMKMSYMGVKNICDELEEKGLIVGWRRPRGVGRPEKAYRVTDSGNLVFQTYLNPLIEDLIKVIEETQGSNVPEKMLHGVYQRMTNRYIKSVSGDGFQRRARSFARIRSNEGYVMRAEDDPDLGVVLVEYHNIMQQLFDKYPSLLRLEEQLVADVLETNIEREEATAGGLKRTVYVEAYGLA